MCVCVYVLLQNYHCCEESHSSDLLSKRHCIRYHSTNTSPEHSSLVGFTNFTNMQVVTPLAWLLSSHTHTRTHTHHSHIHTHVRTHTHTHTLTHSLTHPLTPSLPHSHTHSFPPTLPLLPVQCCPQPRVMVNTLPGNYTVTAARWDSTNTTTRVVTLDPNKSVTVTMTV